MLDQSTRAEDMHAAASGGDFCCLEHAALEALELPVLVHDAERILYANASNRALLGSADPVGLSVDDFIAAESAPASIERRRLMIETDLRLGDIDLKAELPDRGACHLTLRGARVCYGEPPQRGLVQLVHAIDGATLPALIADTPTDATCSEAGPHSCVHSAAFEALPAPLQ